MKETPVGEGPSLAVKRTGGCARFLAILLGLLSPGVQAEGKNFSISFQDPSLSSEQRVDDLVTRLTLEEKIGQDDAHRPGDPPVGCAGIQLVE